jgi:hypothetical protein
MEKVTGQKVLLFFSDAEECYEVDFYHSLFSYWVIGSPLRYRTCDLEDHWMYPSLASLPDPGRKINANLKKLIVPATASVEIMPPDELHVPGVTEYHTGGSYRIGSINQILATPTCTLNNVIAVSGHDHSRVCTVFEYAIAETDGCNRLQSVVWMVKPSTQNLKPKIIILERKESETVPSVCVLNRPTVDLFTPQSELVEPRGNLCCNIYFVFPRMMEDYGLNHLLVIAFLEKMKEHRIIIDEICQWSVSISVFLLACRARGSPSEQAMNQSIRHTCEDLQESHRLLLVSDPQFLPHMSTGKIECDVL